jgi:hypothetical protein
VEERALLVSNDASSLDAPKEKAPRTYQARGATEYKKKNAI